MKKIVAFGILILPLLAKAQIDCPAFGRTQNYERWEILPTWNTVEPYSTLGNFRFTDANENSIDTSKNTGIAPGLTIKYYADNITVIRLKAIYTQRNIRDHYSLSDTLGNFSSTDTHYDQMLFKIAPGFQWTYFIERFSLYGGFEVPFTYHGDFTQTINTVDTNYISQTGSKTKSTVKVPGGYAVGLGFFAGSTFYYKSLFGIGFEISDAYEYSKLGGTVVYDSNTTASGGVTASAHSELDEELHSWKFAQFMASIQLSLRF